MITPQTDVYLLKVPLEINDTNQLTFSDATAQFNYFNSLPKLAVDNYTYQRKDGTIRFGGNYDDIIPFNYVMYRNEAYSNKWFYAFINHKEYLNDNVTAISITTDVWQTWQFDLLYKRVFVEREHVNNDTIGLHTIPENLELGEMVQNYSTTFEPNKTVWTSGRTEQLTNRFMIVFQVSELPEGAYGINKPHEYNSVYSGLFFLGVKSTDDATALIYKYASETKTDAIVAIFMAPTAFFNNCQFSNISTSYGNVTVYYPVDNTGTSSMSDGNYSFNRPNNLNGYVPRNNKLYCYPFSYIMIDNNAGECITERYENFADSATPSYYMGGSLGQGCSIKLAPIGYKGQQAGAENYEEAIIGMKYPICGWASDYYTNWLTQNAVNIPLTVTATAGALGLGIATGGASLVATSGALLTAGTQIGSLLNEQYKASLVPDQAHGNANCSDLNIGWRRCFSVKAMSIKAEYARIIDDYFTMYGYKVNSLKLPNITGRRNWNYVKTVGCYIEADIPQEDLQQIKDMFDKGITLWHNPNTFMDYSQINDII
jgi:hypothetical protein